MKLVLRDSLLFVPVTLFYGDPDRHWEDVMPELKLLVPEPFRFGGYEPAKRVGPALWLRCIEARVIDGAPPVGTTPIFNLSGVSREQLRVAEECPPELAALVELQYRGAMWLHTNGKEWSPYGFLVSRHGGSNSTWRRIKPRSMRLPARCCPNPWLNTKAAA